MAADMNGGMGFVSLDQLEAFNNALNEAKKLPEIQKKLIKQALDGEKKLVETRTKNLEKYFDSYSEKLNQIEKQYKTLYGELSNVRITGFMPSAEGSGPRNSSSSASRDSASSANTTASNGSNNDTRELVSVIRNLVGEIRHGYTSETAATSSGGSRRSSITPRDTLTSGQTDELPVLSLTSIADLEKERKELITKTDNEIHDTKVKLELARRQDQIDGEERLKLLRNQTIKETLDAELKAQELINSIKTEQALLADGGAKDIAAGSASKDELVSAQEQAKKRADFIAAEELKAKLANDGILAEADIRRIRAEADEKFKFDQENLTKITTERLKAEQRVKELGNNPQLAKAREEEMAKYKAKLELAARQANNGILTAEETERIKGLVEERYELEGKEMEKLAKKQLKEDERKAKDDEKNEKRENRKKIDDVVSAALSKDNNLIDRFTALSRATEDKVTDLGGDPEDEGVAKAIAGLDTAMTLLSDLAKQLEGKIDEIATYQGGIDTRLQGSNNEKYRGSYWGQLTRDMMSVGAVTPFFKQEKFAENIKSLVDQGIAFDLKQRAFLMTIQEKIANTFNVADGTLLRLIRIQQEDSTAGRLGMESALNSFLNEMYENTEYLKGVAESVRGSLQEMEALMTGAAATEVEFQVQKWMGSLYSVGMSQEAVQGIANALGQVAAGQIDGLTGGNGAGNLLVMAANNAGLSIADILTDGIDASDTNKLLQATVNYLAEIAESSKGNNVVQQQLASVFGVKASDLRAAVNLVEPGSANDIFGKSLTYDNMLKQLNNMAGSMYQRTSMGEMINNIWENGQYSIASSISNSPLAYLTYKLASLLDSAVGGIALPFINVMGFGVDLNTTVADLMRIGAVGGGILGNLGPMVEGLASSFNGQKMLSTMGIGSGNGLTVTPRGKDGGGIGAGVNLGGGNESTSGSGYVGNSSSSDVKNSTIQEANDSKKQQMVEAKEEEPTNQVDVLNNYVIKIYELLEGVTKGNQTLRVRVDSYGLTGTNSSGGAQGGTSGLLGTSSGSNSLGGGGSSSAGGSDSSFTGTSSGGGSPIDLGGWTMM